MKKAELINLVIVVAISAVTAVWSFLAYTHAKTVESDWSQSENFVFEGTIKAEEKAYVSLNNRDQIVILPGSELDVKFDDINNHFDFDLKKGGIIAATLAGDLDATVSSGFAKVDLKNSITYLAVSDTSLKVYSIDHPVLLTLLADSKDLNSFYVPKNYRTEIQKSKVGASIAKLRLTKLLKEFQLFEFKNTEFSADIQNELVGIETAYEKAANDYMNSLNSNIDLGPGLDGFSSNINSYLAQGRKLLTFLPYAQERLEKSEQENYLNYALANDLASKIDVSEIWLQKWLATDIAIEEKAKINSDMFFVLPGTSLYNLKSAVDENSIYEKFNEIESLLQKSDNVDASQTFQDYKKSFEESLANSTFTAAPGLAELSRRYVLTELLLRSNSIFYTADSVKLLKEVETSILALASSYQDLDEEKLAFVQSKIRFLDNLFNFVQQKKVSVDTGGKVAAQLLSDAEDYLNAISAQVAVKSYFETKLVDYDTSLAFISSPEFSSYTDFTEGLAAFKQKSVDLDQLNAYLQSLRSGKVEDIEVVSLEKATLEVEDDFSSNGIQYAELSSLGDAANRLFEVHGGRVSGKEFLGKYDRETKILYDVTVGDLKFSTGLAVEKFRDVVKNATALVEVADLETVPVTQDSNTSVEEVALSYAESQFDAAGFDSSKFTFKLVDLEKNLFTFDGIAGAENISISGTYDAKSNEASEIVWYYNGSPQTLPNLDLESLESALEATYAALSKI